MTMQKVRKAPPPLKVIETKPNRKSRSETLLRTLVNTSFPHGLVGNLSIDIVKGCGMVDHDELNKMAEGLREAEQELSVFDFIRCIQISRSKGVITVTGKRIKELESLRAATDSKKNLEAFFSNDIVASDEPEIFDPIINAEYAHRLADKIIRAFYRVQSIMPTKRVDIDRVTWKAVARRLENRTVKSFNDLTVTRLEEQFNYESLQGILVNSFTKPEFNIILTPRLINIHDRSIHVSLK